METLITSSSARESRSTRRMMSRAASFVWAGLAGGRRPITRLARSSRSAARGPHGSRLVENTGPYRGQRGRAYHVADARVAPQGDQDDGRSEDTGEGHGGEGVGHLYPRDAHLPVQVDADQGCDRDAEQHGTHRVSARF